MHPTTFFSGFRFPLFVTAVVVLAGGVFGDRPRAQQNTISVRDTNFDIRSASPDIAAAYRNRVALPASAFATLDRVRDDGLAQLRAEFPALETLQSPLSGALEVVGIQPGGGFLDGTRSGSRRCVAGVLRRTRRRIWAHCGAGPEPGTGGRLHEPVREHVVGRIRAAHQRRAGIPGAGARRLHAQWRAGPGDRTAGLGAESGGVAADCRH